MTMSLKKELPWVHILFFVTDVPSYNPGMGTIIGFCARSNTLHGVRGIINFFYNRSSPLPRRHGHNYLPNNQLILPYNTPNSLSVYL